MWIFNIAIVTMYITLYVLLLFSYITLMFIDHYIVYEPNLFSSTSIYEGLLCQSSFSVPTAIKENTQILYSSIIGYCNSEAFSDIFTSQIYWFLWHLFISEWRLCKTFLHFFNNFFLHLFNKFIRAYCVPGATLCTGDTVVNSTKCLHPGERRQTMSECMHEWVDE